MISKIFISKIFKKTAHAYFERPYLAFFGGKIKFPTWFNWNSLFF